jgi:hypothetical protein
MGVCSYGAVNQPYGKALPSSTRYTAIVVALFLFSLFVVNNTSTVIIAILFFV